MTVYDANLVRPILYHAQVFHGEVQLGAVYTCYCSVVMAFPSCFGRLSVKAF